MVLLFGAQRSNLLPLPLFVVRRIAAEVWTSRAQPLGWSPCAHTECFVLSASAQCGTRPTSWRRTSFLTNYLGAWCLVFVL
jgi:hypothetical protein